MTTYRDIIYNCDLYPEDLIKQFGELGAHWSKESWIRREASLRHDMCTILLANLTPEDRDTELRTMMDPDGRPIKYRVIEKPDGSINLIEVFPSVVPSGQKRYIILEGSTIAGLIQQKMAREWKMEEMPIGTWDLVDQRARKFIEVKITKNFQEALNSYHSKIQADRDKYGLVWFHPTDLSSSFDNCKKEDFTGVEKVISFLAKRSLILTEANLMTTNLNEEEDLESTVMISPGVNSLVELWKSKWLNLDAPRMTQEEIYNAPVPSLKLVTYSELKENLEDPSKRDCPTVKYNGKILPESLVHHLYTSAFSDKEMVVELLNTWNLEIAPRDPDSILTQILRETLEILEENRFTLKNDHKTLKFLLGVGAKKKVYNAQDTTTKIPNRERAKPLRYHPWMHTIIREMTLMEPEVEGVAFPELLEEECDTNHPMEKIAKIILKEVTQIFCRGLVGHWCQKMKNLYSRIGGVYSNKGEGSLGHNNIAMFPLYSKVNTRLDTNTPLERRMSGIIIRAPDHSRSASDKINVVVIEMTRADETTRKYHEHIKCNAVVKGTDYDLIIRQNAIMKLDPSYLTFSPTSLFNVTNFIGEMVLFESSTKEFADPIRESRIFCETYRTWIKERLAECTFMMIMGSSQEEGLLAMHRMLFMMILNMERGKECFVYNIQGFCQKVNECVIDKPLAMYFQKCMVDTVSILCT